VGLVVKKGWNILSLIVCGDAGAVVGNPYYNVTPQPPEGGLKFCANNYLWFKSLSILFGLFINYIKRIVYQIQQNPARYPAERRSIFGSDRIEIQFYNRH
jgi:hypothetical protein